MRFVGVLVGLVAVGCGGSPSAGLAGLGATPGQIQAPDAGTPETLGPGPTEASPQPDASPPTSPEAGIALPDAVAPEAGDPASDAGAPETGMPEASAPEAAAPEASSPEASAPEASAAAPALVTCVGEWYASFSPGYQGLNANFKWSLQLDFVTKQVTATVYDPLYGDFTAGPAASVLAGACAAGPDTAPEGCISVKYSAGTGSRSWTLWYDPQAQQLGASTPRGLAYANSWDFGSYTEPSAPSQVGSSVELMAETCTLSY